MMLDKEGNHHLFNLIDRDHLNLIILKLGRRSLYRWLIVFCSSSILIGNVFAQVPKSYTINELITIALESSPQVLAARDQSKAIKG